MEPECGETTDVLSVVVLKDAGVLWSEAAFVAGPLLELSDGA